jgi:hypothetical protein
MRRLRLPILLALFAGSVAATDPIVPPPVPATLAIDPADVRAHLYLLASPEMEGRGTPSRGLKLAARYIATRFREAGFQPAPGLPGFEQAYELEAQGFQGSELALRQGDETQKVALGQWWPVSSGGEGSAEGDVVFAGYGIASEDPPYDDYAGLDVRGKIVLVLRHQPREKAPAAERRRLPGSMLHKIEAAAKRGAAGVLIVGDPLNHEADARKPEEPRRSWRLPVDAREPRAPATPREPAAPRLPAASLDPAALEAILPGAVERLVELQKAVDQDLKPRAFALPGVSARLHVKRGRETVSVTNVVGYLPGRDPELQGEVVVVGAHYDHEGIQGGQIYFGADDNASGTTAVLSLAAAFGQSPLRPRRSVIVVAFSGEERGLLGSRAYVQNPPVPLERTVAMVNMDMVGRNDAGAISVIGGGFSPELKALVEDVAPTVGLKPDFEDGERQGLLGRSDQASFYNRGVPILFFFSGFHDDYHRPTDTPDKIGTDKVARVARMAFAVTWRVAERTSRPKLVRPAPNR